MDCIEFSIFKYSHTHTHTHTDRLLDAASISVKKREDGRWSYFHLIRYCNRFFLSETANSIRFLPTVLDSSGC